MEYRVTVLLLDMKVGFLYVEHIRKPGPMLVQVFFYMDTILNFPHEEHMSVRAHAVSCVCLCTVWGVLVSGALTHMYMEGWQCLPGKCSTRPGGVRFLGTRQLTEVFLWHSLIPAQPTRPLRKETKHNEMPVDCYTTSLH